MQDELDALATPVPIRIVGVNEEGHEDGNAMMVSGRDLPWLQDTAAADVWTTWDPVYRDVIIVDGENHVVTAFNLTDNDLAEPAAYQALRELFVDAAEAEAAE